MLPLFKRNLFALLALWAVVSPCAASADTTTLPVGGAASQQATAPASPSALTKTEDLKVEVSDIEGVVSVQPRGLTDFTDARQYLQLRSGDTIRTGQGSCRLTIDGKAGIFLGPETTLQITEALKDKTSKHETTHLTLETGQLRAKLSKLKVGSTFEVTTPTAIAAVRGTTFYLKSGTFAGQPGSQLYVDETKSGVLFTNLLSHKELLVPAFSLSHALQDGTLDPPNALNKEQQAEFLKNWNPAGGPSQQFGIEESPLPAAGLPPAAVEPLVEPLLDDAKLERLSEQSIPDLNDLPVLPAPVFALTPKEPPDEEEKPAETPGEPDTTPDPGQGTGNDNTGNPTEEPTETPPDETPSTDQLLEQQERDMIRQEIAGLLGDQDFDHADANLARIADAQTGKTFTDVHGYRVRVDQYIFHNIFPQTGESIVSLLSLTARTGPYQTGVSGAWFLAHFNREITEADGPLRDLPWNDWMRVVRHDQLTGDEALASYDQFIVHEHYANSEAAPDLYMTSLGVIIGNPSSFGLTMAEGYSAPFHVQSDQGSFWVQGLEVQGLVFNTTSNQFVSFNEMPFESEAFLADGIGVTAIPFTTRDGSQTAGLAGDPRLADLDTAAGIEAFRNSTVHPAFFENTFNGNLVLLGMFLPINDQGQVIDAPGFQPHSIRDILSPNSLVNGGNYNLEMIFVHGTDDDGIFTENYRVDTIITPEIFAGFGAKNSDGTPNNSTVFPDRLESDNQNV